MNKKYLRYALEIAFFAALVAIDLVSKSIVFEIMSGKTAYSVWEGVFAVKLARNTGASFSIMSGQLTFLTIMPTIAIVAIIAFLIIRPNTPKNLRIGCIMIAAGALGNLIDRFVLGYVRDFIDYTFLYTWFGIDFAIGNIADLFLLGGVIMIILYIIFEFDEKDFYSKKKLEKLALMSENKEENIVIEQPIESENKDGE